VRSGDGPGKPAPVTSPSSVDSAVSVTHVTVIDTETGKEARDRTVIISGEKISGVRDRRKSRLTSLKFNIIGSMRWVSGGENGGRGDEADAWRRESLALGVDLVAPCRAGMGTN